LNKILERLTKEGAASLDGKRGIVADTKSLGKEVEALTERKKPGTARPSTLTTVKA
jgi:hypothetical protein